MPTIDDAFRGLDDDARSRLGGAAGAPDEQITRAGEMLGLRRRYGGGVIIWRASTNQAWAVYGSIYNLYQAQGEVFSSLGWPTSHELAWVPRGRVSHFERADIYWNGGDAYIVFTPPPPRRTDPVTDGAWAIAPWKSGVVGVHAALLPSPPRVLFFTYRPPDDPEALPTPQRYGQAAIVDLATGRVDRGGPWNLENIFCSGHAFDLDGRLIVVGGEREMTGIRNRPVNTVFAVDTARTGGAGGEAALWSLVATTRQPRWYPTCAPLQDGSVVAVGGTEMHGTRQDNLTFEVVPARLRNIAFPVPALSGATGFLVHLRFNSSYPIVYLLPNRKLFVHAGRTTKFVDTATWAVEPSTLATIDPTPRTYNLSGTSVLLPLRPTTSPPYRARVMLIGGGHPGGLAEPANATCEILDMGRSPLAWRPAAPMANRRVMADSVLLPDGTVLVTNGSATGHADAGPAPVYDAEIYDPATNRWRTVAPMSVPRLYHATALLLPDGRVLTAGTDASWNPPPFNRGELRVELYSPPYLFRGRRPVIEAAPDNVAYGQAFTVQTPDWNRVDGVALVRCGSVTHSFNADQRWVGTEITERASGRLTLLAPPDGYVAPPGYYLLFLLVGGVPSIGRSVQLGVAALQRNLTVNADTGATLVTIPGLGSVMVSASDPATSSLSRFVNLSGQSLTLEQELTGLSGPTVRTGSTVAARGIYSLPLDATRPELNRWTLVWRVRTAASGGPAARIEMIVENGPGNANFATFSAAVTILPG